MIVGFDFSKNIDSLIDNIKTDFLAPSQQSVIVALKIAHQRYKDSLEERNKNRRGRKLSNVVIIDSVRTAIGKLGSIGKCSCRFPGSRCP